MIIDTHCHLESYDNIDDIVNFDGIMIAAGCNDETNLRVVELVNKYSNIYGTLGIHPEELDNVTDNSFKIIEDNLSNKKIVGIGEIGLDYYYDDTRKEEQKELFIKQLELASKFKLPVVIHSRDSIADTYNIMSNYQLKGNIHCFSSSLEMAKKFIKLGYKIGIGGVLTFKNGKKLQEIVKNIDINDIVLETDSPYLTPEPYRGHKNEPKNVIYVANKISELKGISIEKVIEITTNTAISQFDLDI